MELFWPSKILLHQGCSVDGSTSEGKTVLHATAMNQDDNTALHYATVNGNVELVELLAMREVVQLSNLKGETMTLHLAAAKGTEGIIRVLLIRGVDANAKTKEYHTAVYKAAERGHEAIVGLLVGIMGEAESQSISAMRVAVRAGHGAIVRMLITRTKKKQAATVTMFSLLCINRCDSIGYTKSTLQVASERGYCQIVILIAARWHTCLVPGGYASALANAAERGHHEFVLAVLNMELVKDIFSIGIEAACDLALAGRHWTILEILPIDRYTQYSRAFCLRPSILFDSLFPTSVIVVNQHESEVGSPIPSEQFPAVMDVSSSPNTNFFIHSQIPCIGSDTTSLCSRQISSDSFSPDMRDK
ncbi:vegetative incompatibility protein het-e-1 [Venturia nashicola]|uniref:protein S-acyltransferase n=1 Tax=Venturia nashicola TaxID=86259 RepID=A0A4Z1NTH5_9PEZI|nr:vegetative incompatibility protein het-e-1 [Venturia nashicola]